MAVDHRAAMARNMFDHRQKAACDQTIGKSAPDDRRRLRITRIGTIANRIGHAFNGQIKNRSAVDCDPDLKKIMSDKARG